MASNRLPPTAGGRASAPAPPTNPNPTSAQYAAQRGSVDLLMQAKTSTPKAAPTGIARGPASTSTPSAAAPKMTFLEAVRAQRLEKASMARARTGAAATVITTSTPSNFTTTTGRAPKAGSFSALVAGKNPKPQKTPAPAAFTTTSTTTTTTTTAIPAAVSFEQVQDELEADFQRYSRANPLGGVGASLGKAGAGAGASDTAESDSTNTKNATTATARQAKARQLMVAPVSRADRQMQYEQQQKQKQPAKTRYGGDDSSDEDVGRSALGRKRARR